MKKIYSITLFVLSISLGLYAQTNKATLLNYDWEENRARYQLTPEEEQLPKIILLSKTIYEYVFENNEFVMYSLDHMISRVNSDEAIEKSNKIYISLYNTIDVINIKARSISKDGKVIVLDKNNIKEIKNDENNEASRKFAIEGVEKGSEIEYFFVKKMAPKTYGSDVFQYAYPVKQAYLQIILPSHLAFKFKGYNGFPAIKDTIINEIRTYTAQKSDIPELEDETYSNYQKNRMRLEFKLAFNLAKGNKEMNTWADIAQKQYESTEVLTPKETKIVEKFFKTLKIEDNASVETKIRTIENYIKTNILLKELYDEEYYSLEKIISNKYGNIHGIKKLYAALFRLANVSYQEVLTSERNNVPFDGSFESWRLLNNFLFYFPETDKFLAPEEPYYRYPLIPYYLTFTDGLFLKLKKVGDFASYIPSVKFIPPLPYDLSGQRIDANVEFEPGMEEAIIKVTNTLKGYHAIGIQPVYSQIPDDKKPKVLEEIMNGITQDTKYTKLTAENTDPNSPIDKPFKVYAEVKGSSLLEKAGNKVLFKVGELLDKQSEMYQDKKRKMDVECDYNREYIREITFKIPQGYKIKNLDDINMNITFDMKGDTKYGFISNYKLDGQLVTISINEFYKEIACPVANFEDYRKVINAAADFNKVVLVFEPIQ